MSKEDKTKITSLDQTKITELIKKGELVVPSGNDRNEFLNFVAKTPEERLKEINGDTIVPAAPATPATPAEGADKDGKGTESSTDTGGDEPWWKKEFGYDNEDKVKETHKSLLESVARLQSQIDQMNAKGGKTGQELKQLREMNARMESELKELKKTPEITKPEKPKRPKVSDFEDGMLDSKYLEETEKYEAEMEEYEEKREKYYEYTRNRDRETVLAEVSKVSVPEKTESEYDRVFDVEVPVMQAKFGLTTTTPIKAIQDACILREKGKPDEKVKAEAFIKNLPPKDVEAFNKVSQALTVAYDWSNNIPMPKYKSIEGALYDNGMLGDGKPFNYIKQSQLSAEEEKAMIDKKRKENEQYVEAPPAAGSANHDTPPSGVLSLEEKKKRMWDLSLKYNSVIATHNKQTIEEYEKTNDHKEYLALKAELIKRR